MTSWTQPPSASTSSLAGEGRALLQRRVALFCLVFGLIGALAAVARGLLILRYGGQIQIPLYTVYGQAIAAAALLSVYVLLRTAPRSARTIRGAEGLALSIVALALQSIALVLTLDVVETSVLHRLAVERDTQLVATFAVMLPFSAVSFMLTYAMVLRATFVPTAPRHTVILTAVVGAPQVLVAYTAGLGTGPIGLPFLSAPSLAIVGAVSWAFTVAICGVISRVIYGLREEARVAQRLGQYTLEALIGEGGMGMVYRASHLLLRRPTAIKLLPPERAGEAALERFEREVQLTAQLTHPNTVTIFDYGRTDEGVLYYAMELLDGATLEEIVDVDGAQPPARVVWILEQVAGALGEAHGIGLIHRDVKPANIVLCKQGGELDFAKVVDFGLVKELDRGDGAAVSLDGTISGTPLYMAPEILKTPDAASPASDLYALGAVGYYLLTGEHVFGGGSVIEVLSHHLHTAPEPPSSRLGEPLPPALERVILDCLAKDPAARPDSMSELLRRLEACGLPRWTQRGANNWWEAHGPALAACRTVVPAGRRAKTIKVDVEQREPE